MDGSLVEDGLPSAYFVVACETCGEILLYDAIIDIPEDEDFHLARLVWPKPGGLHSAVPKAVAECYAEAAIIRNRAPNAFAVQIRRSLEALCDDRGAKKGSLQLRLEDLSSKGDIPPVLAKMTKVLRLLGNIGAHAANQSIKQGHVQAINDFFRAIIEYVYVAPSKLKEFQDRLKRFGHKQDGDNDA